MLYIFGECNFHFPAASQQMNASEMFQRRKAAAQNTGCTAARHVELCRHSRQLQTRNTGVDVEENDIHNFTSFRSPEKSHAYSYEFGRKTFAKRFYNSKPACWNFTISIVIY